LKKLKKAIPETKKQEQSKEIDRFVKKAFDFEGVGSNSAYLYPEFTFEEIGFSDILTENELDSISKVMTEVGIFNAVKNNKRFQKVVDKVVANLTQEIMVSLREAKKQRESDRKYEEKERIKQEEYAAKQKKMIEEQAESIKKQNAQLAVLSEGLTAAQKKALKKFYNVDMSKQQPIPKFNSNDWDY
jgi:hypothetical protein